MEMLTQSEAIRKRYRYLSHFSLTTTIQVINSLRIPCTFCFHYLSSLFVSWCSYVKLI